MKKLLINCAFIYYSSGRQKMENYALIISINQDVTNLKPLILNVLEKQLAFNCGNDEENILRFTAQII